MRTTPLSVAGLTRAALSAACLAATLPVGTLAQGDFPSLVWYANTTPVPVADLATTETLFYVDGVAGPILDVRVSLHITHPLAADLDISLEGPDGTTVDLTSDNGGAGANYGSACTPESSRTTFDDAAATAIQRPKRPAGHGVPHRRRAHRRATAIGAPCLFGSGEPGDTPLDAAGLRRDTHTVRAQERARSRAGPGQLRDREPLSHLHVRRADRVVLRPHALAGRDGEERGLQRDPPARERARAAIAAGRAPGSGQWLHAGPDLAEHL